MPKNDANLSVSWKALAIASFVVTLTALTITAIVATVKNADVLSVVALGLAVIAFVIQIIVFIVQAAATTQQQLRSEEIYGSTLKALATIEEKSEGTQKTVTVINERLLSALIGKAVPTAAFEGVSPLSPEFSEMVAKTVARLAESNQGNILEDIESSGKPNRPKRINRSNRSSESSEYGTTPSLRASPTVAEIRTISSKINDLTDEDILDLVRLGLDQERYLDPDAGIAPGVESITNGEHLERQGLIKEAEADWTSERVWRLTQLGEIAVRTLIADFVPKEVANEISEVRRKAEKEERAWRTALRATVSAQDEQTENVKDD